MSIFFATVVLTRTVTATVTIPVEADSFGEAEGAAVSSAATDVFLSELDWDGSDASVSVQGLSTVDSSYEACVVVVDELPEAPSTSGFGNPAYAPVTDAPVESQSPASPAPVESNFPKAVVELQDGYQAVRVRHVSGS